MNVFNNSFLKEPKILVKVYKKEKFVMEYILMCLSKGKVTS